MSHLADFIDANTDAILNDWVRFATTLAPMTGDTPIECLRDHAADMLARITNDLRQTQTPRQQQAKSEGRRDAPVGVSPAGRHGSDRQAIGLDVSQMMGEFRALRATVIRLWAASGGASEPNAFDELLRFNESIDQALAESTNAFAGQVEHFRQIMLGMIAHDLRGPLNVLKMSAHILTTTHTQLAHDPAMARVLRAIDRMRGLVNDLMDVAGAQLGIGLPVVRSSVDLLKLAQEAVEDAHAEYPHIDFVLQCDSRLDGKWDRERLAQVLSNLFRNAAEHGDPAHPVRCTITPTEEGATIEVQNHGPVIPLREQAAVFRALVRGGSDSEPRQHLGLGLYICREIVERHGGSIAGRSDEEEGTVFSVFLPHVPSA